MQRSETHETFGQRDAAFQAAKYLVAVDNCDLRGMRLAKVALEKLGWELRRITQAPQSPQGAAE